MLTTTLKDRPCTHCGKCFAPRSSFQTVCKPACLLKQINREERQKKAEAKIKNRLEREQFKERKAKLKRIPDLIKEAQTAFNAYIRARDAEQRCISCGVLLSREAIGGGFDAGHYRSRGSAKHLSFHEDNCHGQCKRCNRYGAGMAVDYRIGLVRRIGLARVEALEADSTVRKWGRDELIAIRAEYVAKLKELRRAAP